MNKKLEKKILNYITIKNQIELLTQDLNLIKDELITELDINEHNHFECEHLKITTSTTTTHNYNLSKIESLVQDGLLTPKHLIASVKKFDQKFLEKNLGVELYTTIIESESQVVSPRIVINRK